MALFDALKAARGGGGAVPGQRPMAAAPGMAGSRFGGASQMQARRAPQMPGGMGAARGMFGRGAGSPGGMSAARGMFGRGGGGAMSAARGMMGGGARPQMPGGGAMGAARGMFGGGGGSPGGGAMGAARGMFGGAPPRPATGAMRQPMLGAGAAGAMLSDERSKERIRELEAVKDRYEALLDTPSATAESFRGVSSNEYSYRDPDEPGAAPGRHVGPMASDLRSLPGVVERGRDGMDRVNPDRLSLANASATGELSREVEDLRSRLAALSDDPNATLDVAGGRRR